MNLNTLGWALIILGAIQITGGISPPAGVTCGRIIGARLHIFGEDEPRLAG